jgi:hypothetical protein
MPIELRKTFRNGMIGMVRDQNFATTVSLIASYYLSNLRIVALAYTIIDIIIRNAIEESIYTLLTLRHYLTSASSLELLLDLSIVFVLPEVPTTCLFAYISSLPSNISTVKFEIGFSSELSMILFLAPHLMPLALYGLLYRQPAEIELKL